MFAQRFGAGAACDVKGFNALILNSYKRALAVERTRPRTRGAQSNMLDFNHASLSSGRATAALNSVATRLYPFRAAHVRVDSFTPLDPRNLLNASLARSLE